MLEMEFDNQSESSTNSLQSATQKKTRPTSVSAHYQKSCCYWILKLVIVLVLRCYPSWPSYSALLDRRASRSILLLSNSSSLPRLILLKKLFKDIQQFCFGCVFVVNLLLHKISKTLSTAQISSHHLSNPSNNKIGISRNNITIRRVEREGESKTLVKSTTTATQTNKLAESLPSEVASQAAMTAAVVAVVDCSYSQGESYRKVFTPVLLLIRDFMNDIRRECKSLATCLISGMYLARMCA